MNIVFNENEVKKVFQHYVDTVLKISNSHIIVRPNIKPAKISGYNYHGIIVCIDNNQASKNHE